VGLFVRGVETEVIRVKVSVRFRAPDGTWTRQRDGIVDTGSPHSVVPRSAWQDARHVLLSDAECPIGGVGGGARPARIAQLQMAVEDGSYLSPPLAIRAFPVPDDSEPLLLGFQDFLSRVVLHCDCPQDEVYLRFPSTLGSPSRR
jgi:hypothetical protein